MKKCGVLDHQIARAIAAMGHTDLLVVGDAGLPVPPGVALIDLAVVAGVPRLLDVVRAIATELEVEAMTVAAELLERDTGLPTALRAAFPGATFDAVSHEELKAISAHARAVVRTGECTPYANVILRAGVAF